MRRMVRFLRRIMGQNYLISKCDCDYCGGTGLDPTFGLCECVKEASL